MPKTHTKCELILASRNAITGDVVYTFKRTFPRIILAETNTHLVVAKNAASSRAIPTLRQLRNILKDPFIPISIGQYQKGMQAGAEIKGWRRWTNEKLWSVSRYVMVLIAWLSYKLGAPKQFSNRLVEPWMWVEQVATTTDVENEIMLRNHYMAEPHYEELAAQQEELVRRIQSHFKGEIDTSLVRLTQTIRPGEWHLPFTPWWDFKMALDSEYTKGIITHSKTGIEVLGPDGPVPLDGVSSDIDIAKAVSAGRCAWVSYYMPGNESAKISSVSAALLTFRKLAVGKIRHLSPLMHVATPLPFSVRVGTLCGWMMFRKELEGEAGGDKVVCSITPSMARNLLANYKNHKSLPDMIESLGEEFKSDLRKQVEN